jgi:hypothetical protein
MKSIRFAMLRAAARRARAIEVGVRFIVFERPSSKGHD